MMKNCRAISEHYDKTSDYILYRTIDNGTLKGREESSIRMVLILHSWMEYELTVKTLNLIMSDTR